MTIVCGNQKSDTLYMATYNCGSISIVMSKEDLNLWYQRFGHLSSKGLKIMHSNGKLLGLKSNDIDMCESYIFRKQRRVNFKKVGRIQKNKKLIQFRQMFRNPLHFIN